MIENYAESVRPIAAPTAEADIHSYGRRVLQVELRFFCALAITLIAFVGSGREIRAQGALTGHVVNARNNSPISLATIDVTIPGTAQSAGRAATATDGSFRIEGLAPGRYNVRVRALGFTPRPLAPIDITASSTPIDIGTITLSAAPVQLQSLQVTGQRQDVELAPDRNTYIVRDMPTTRGGTALDVLRNVPSVDVDIDNVVSLRGNPAVTVQINGRASPMKPAQLGNFLAQLPANIVDKVEVVPNPSARDDPEGIAGIINIVLKEKPEAGKSAALTFGGGTTGHADIGGNAGYERGPLSLYGGYGFLRDSRPRTDAIRRENRYLTPVTFLEESGRRTQIPLAHTFTGSANYQLDKHDELSYETVYSTRVEAETYDLLYRDLDASRKLSALSDRKSRGTNHEFSFESALGYKHTFPEKGHKLTSELRMTRDGEGGPTSTVAHSLHLDGIVAGISANEKVAAWEHPGEYSLKTDYVRPLSSGFRIETGYKGSIQHIHTTLDTRVFNDATSTYITDSERTSNFTYDQTVNAGYGMIGRTSGKFQLQGGVRLEHAATQFRLKTTGANYDNVYNSIFPSALVAYNIDDGHQLKLSYSTRIRRPDDTDQLDPTPHFADPLNLSRGNPYLRPEYIRALELGVQRSTDKISVQVTPFYRHSLDAVRTLRTIDTAGVSTRTFANIATTNAYGTDATVALSGGRVSGFAGASAYRQMSDASFLGNPISSRTFGWTARTNTSYRISSTLDVQALLSYQAPMNVEQGRNASRTRLSLAARQKLMNDEMSLTLRVIDPFNTSLEQSTTVDPTFYQVSDRRRLIRGLLLSFNWNFGEPPKEEHNPIDPGESGQ